jgi:hypothetical protein
MLAEIGMGLNSLKAATDIVKGLNAVATQTAINDVKLTLQQHIFEAREALGAAQEAQSAALKRIGELEREIASFKNWEAEKQRYELETLPPGIHMYRLKRGMENGEPPHKICANCYNQGFKSLLHVTGQGNGLTSWKCHKCGFDEHTGHFIDRNPGPREPNPYY